MPQTLLVAANLLIRITAGFVAVHESLLRSVTDIKHRRVNVPHTWTHGTQQANSSSSRPLHKRAWVILCLIGAVFFNFKGHGLLKRRPIK